MMKQEAAVLYNFKLGENEKLFVRLINIYLWGVDISIVVTLRSVEDMSDSELAEVVTIPGSQPEVIMISDQLWQISGLNLSKYCVTCQESRKIKNCL